MLQQTTVTTVIPYYAKFLARYPTIAAMAAAPVEDVLGLWAGLGYYARARNLHACAKAVTKLGDFPASVEGLRALPGIGPYTANAIGAIAYALPVLPVDGNIERVTARIFAITASLPAAKPVLAKAALAFMQDKAAQAAPGDFAQSLFDLGAGICTPRNPACNFCPWAASCRAYALGLTGQLPMRSPKPARPHRTGTAYVLLDRDENVLLERRPPTGLLGGMLVLPEAPPIRANWRNAGLIEHVFTHFSLTLAVKLMRTTKLPANSIAAPARTAALPSVMRKALDAGLNALDD